MGIGAEAHGEQALAIGRVEYASCRSLPATSAGAGGGAPPKKGTGRFRATAEATAAEAEHDSGQAAAALLFFRVGSQLPDCL